MVLAALLQARSQLPHWGVGYGARITLPSTSKEGADFLSSRSGFKSKVAVYTKRLRKDHTSLLALVSKAKLQIMLNV